MKTRKSEFKEIVGYGIGGVGEDIAYNIFYMFFIFFLTTVAGITPAAAGTISLCAVAWDAISDPIIGYLSDKYKGNKFGKRATFILGGAIPLGICVFLLFCDVDLGSGAKFAYFIGINILFWLFFTIVDIPYISVASEITSDYDVKTKMRTSVLLFSNLGQMILAFGIMKFIEIMQGCGQEDVLTWRIIGAVLGTITAIAFLLTAVSLRGKEAKAKIEMGKTVEHNSENEAKGNVLQDVLDFFKLKQFRLVAAMGFVYNINLGVVNSSLMFYLMYACQFTTGEIAFINLWPLVISIFLIVPMGGFAVKFGKRTGMMSAFIFLVLFSIVMSFTTPNMPTMIVMVAGLMVACAAFWILIYAMNFDVAEIYEFRFEKNREGLMISIVSFLTKLGVALGMWANGMLMTKLGVDPTSTVVTEAMSSGMHTIFGKVPLVLTITMVVLCIFYKISKNKITALQEAKALKAEGKEYSTEGFADIL
ncbi:MAG: MFS transporter [Lachnospiraceae bacterium]